LGKEFVPCKGFVGDYPNIINNINRVDQATIERLNQPNPSQEEIKRRIREREWLRYQRRNKQGFQQSQHLPK
jgi:hypothetical protein